MRKKLLKIAITFAIGAALMLAIYFFTQNDLEQSPDNTFKRLSDAALLPAALIGGGGLLIFCSHGGAFDMLSFGVKKVFSIFKAKSKKETFYEYREKRAQKHSSYSHLLIVGGFFLVLSIIFTLFFMF